VGAGAILGKERKVHFDAGTGAGDGAGNDADTHPAAGTGTSTGAGAAGASAGEKHAVTDGGEESGVDEKEVTTATVTTPDINSVSSSTHSSAGIESTGTVNVPRSRRSAPPLSLLSVHDSGFSLGEGTVGFMRGDVVEGA
jgi:hypothetical protein